LVGKCRKTVPIATPARRATSSVDAVAPCSAKTAPATSRMRARLRTASALGAGDHLLDNSARELYDRWKQNWTAETPAPDHFADDVVIERPFDSDTGRRRTVGRAEWLEYANASRAVLPVRIDGYREIAVHETADPEVIVAEYELTGTAIDTGRRSTAGFVGVLRVRAGKIVLWREYQDVLALSAALGRRPEALDGLG
jgi:uncharacterized protein